MENNTIYNNSSNLETIQTQSNYFELEMTIPNVIHKDMSRRETIKIYLIDLIQNNIYTNEIKFLLNNKTLTLDFKFKLLHIDESNDECVVQAQKLYIREEKRHLFKKRKLISLVIKKYANKNLIQHSSNRLIQNILEKRKEKLFNELVSMVSELPYEMRLNIYKYYQEPKYIFYTKGVNNYHGRNYLDKYSMCIEIIRYSDGGISYKSNYGHHFGSLPLSNNKVLFIKYHAKNEYEKKVIEFYNIKVPRKIE